MNKKRFIKGSSAGFKPGRYCRKQPDKNPFVSEEELLGHLIFEEKKQPSQRESLVIAFIVSIILLLASSFTL